MAKEGAAQPRAAAAVILLRRRESSGEAEVFLLRRHRKASFMSSSFVFPGGIADEGEDDRRVTAARELFEEAGVLLVDREVPADALDQWRRQVNAGEIALADLLAREQLTLALDRLHYFAHWITPSIEPRRYTAQFFVTELPAGQTPSFDNRETVDEVWATPEEALARCAELRLPPPQVRTLFDLCADGEGGVDAIFAAAERRAEHPHAIMPVPLFVDGVINLLLPWDPEYETSAAGEGTPMPAGHPLAIGPSRFVLEEMAWKLAHAPGSPSAE